MEFGNLMSKFFIENIQYLEKNSISTLTQITHLAFNRPPKV